MYEKQSKSGIKQKNFEKSNLTFVLNKIIISQVALSHNSHPLHFAHHNHDA
jgi:hypothetical protein